MKRRVKRQKRFRKKPRRGYSLEEKKRYAKKLRKRMTPSEVCVWTRLKKVQHIADAEFEPQVVCCGYIPDFVCEKSKVIVEIDGPIHRFLRKRDAVRQKNLERQGYLVLRYSNSEATWRTEEVVEDMLSYVVDRLP